MSDNTNPTNPTETNQTPDGGAGQTPDAAPTPDAGAENPQAGQQPGQGEPFAVFPDAESFNRRLQRETRRSLDQHAQAAGFDNWQAMLDSRNTPPPAAESDEQPDTEPAGEQPTASSQQPAASLDEAARLRMAIEVGGDKGLPPALLSRLQGTTREELEADADRLLQVVQAGQPRPPGIPGVPRNEQTTTFTRAQLRDPAFVREHATEIQRAAREGRIVDA